MAVALDPDGADGTAGAPAGAVIAGGIDDSRTSYSCPTASGAPRGLPFATPTPSGRLKNECEALLTTKGPPMVLRQPALSTPMTRHASLPPGCSRSKPPRLRS